MSNISNNKKGKMHTGLSLEDRYVMLFDNVMKYLDSLGYKCVFSVKLRYPWGFNYDYDANTQYRVHYAVQYRFVKKDVDDAYALMSSTDVYAPDCARLNRFLYENRAFMQKGKDVNDSLFCENYITVSLREMFVMFRTPKKLFCSLFIPDILNCGIAIRDTHAWIIKQVIVRQNSSIEEALLNLDLLAA